MKLSVIIVNFRNPSLLRLSLTSLRRALPAQLQHEVIVIDSESTPETRIVVTHDFRATFDALTCVPFAENIGYTRGVNEGLRRASGEFLLILNPDVIILPGSLATMMQFLSEHPSTGLLGPGLLNIDSTRQDSCFSFYTPAIMISRRLPLPGSSRLLDAFLLRSRDLTETCDVDWVMGSALMVSRTSLERVGMMDESFFLYLSEVDWAHRFWENGLSVTYLPSAKMYHYHQRESKGRLGILDILFRQQTRWHLKDALHYFRKHGTSGLRPGQSATM